MSYVKTINEDGTVSDIMAKAIDPTLDATILKKSNLVNGFTQTDAGVNALDAAAGKTLNDALTEITTGFVKMGYDSIAGGGSKTVSMRYGIIFTWRRNVTSGIWGISDDDVSPIADSYSGNITVTAADGVVTIANAATTTCRFAYLKHS